MTSKDSFDPGWNDPPIFTYDKAASIQAAAAGKKGTYLNKRVAFPISGSVGGEQENVPNSIMDSAKPPPMSQQLSVAQCTVPVASASTDIKGDFKDRLEKVLQNLHLETNTDEEIVKRIRIMEKMWIENKLDENVQSKIFELSEALARNDPEMADHIQKSLMVDYASQCSTWMSGIRHLINRMRFCES